MIDTPGHTRGHIAFFFPDGDVLLCGDTLFSLGCGRLLEGTAGRHVREPAQVRGAAAATRWSAAATNTPRATRASRCTPIPHNAALQSFAAHVKELRAAGKPTLPSRLSDELAANPFLRAPDVATLADLRARKDKF